MKLLNEINEQVNLFEFNKFLDELEEIGLDFGHPVVSVHVYEHIDAMNLNEIDYRAHDELAQARGARGHEYDARVQKALAGDSKFSIQEPMAPKAGQMVKKDGKFYVINAVIGKRVALGNPKEKPVANKFSADQTAQRRDIGYEDIGNMKGETHGGRTVWMVPTK